MNQNSKKTIEAIAIIEKDDFNEVVPPWNVSPLTDDSYFTHIRIHSEISDGEIGLVILEAIYPNFDEMIKKTAAQTLQAFVSDESFVLSGGLRFEENDMVVVSPSCCCGLEDWVNWLNVPNGETQIWNGHDPDAFVEINDDKIKIWEDEKLKDKSPSVIFSIKEFVENMKAVETDLKGFLIRLGQWTRNIEPALEKQVVNYFAENMHIEV